jgi:hypothetical protein
MCGFSALKNAHELPTTEGTTFKADEGAQQRIGQ